MPHTGVPIVLQPGAGPTIEGPVGGPLTYKVRGEQSNGRLAVLENAIPAGGGPPVHTHANEHEAWYVLEGELRFMVDAEESRLPAHPGGAGDVLRARCRGSRRFGRPGGVPEHRSRVRGGCGRAPVGRRRARALMTKASRQLEEMAEFIDTLDEADRRKARLRDAGAGARDTVGAAATHLGAVA
jgi:hypothetical protein